MRGQRAATVSDASAGSSSPAEPAKPCQGHWGSFLSWVGDSGQGPRRHDASLLKTIRGEMKTSSRIKAEKFSPCVNCCTSRCDLLDRLPEPLPEPGSAIPANTPDHSCAAFQTSGELCFGCQPAGHVKKCSSAERLSHVTVGPGDGRRNQLTRAHKGERLRGDGGRERRRQVVFPRRAGNKPLLTSLSPTLISAAQRD